MFGWLTRGNRKSGNEARTETDLAIIGCGYSGTQAAVSMVVESNYYRSSFKRKQTLSMIERDEPLRFGGVAYAEAATDPAMYTNVAATLFSSYDTRIHTDGYLQSKWKRPKGTPHAHAGQLTVPRHLLQGYYKKVFEEAVSSKGSMISSAPVTGEAVRLTEKGRKVEIEMADGRRLSAKYVMITTGNDDPRVLPCMEGREDDPEIAPYYISPIWKPEQREKMYNVAPDAPVLIVGTGLGGYDAAVTLLDRGHKGEILLVSKHAYEHRPFPSVYHMGSMDSRYVSYPHFLSRNFSSDPRELAKTASEKFEELTGYRIDFETGEMTPPETRDPQHLEPWFVMRQWESALPDLARHFGAAAVGRAMARNRSMVNTLRVGASNEVCAKIDAAKARGQLKVKRACVDGIDPAGNLGLYVQFRTHAQDGERTEARTYARVVSTLGSNYDYSKTNNPLWKNALADGLTTPHETGIGISVDDQHRLVNTKRIFCAGVPTAGERMIDRGLCGSALFSVKRMQPEIAYTARNAIRHLRADR